mgnify:FL=1
MRTVEQSRQSAKKFEKKKKTLEKNWWWKGWCWCRYRSLCRCRCTRILHISGHADLEIPEEIENREHNTRKTKKHNCCGCTTRSHISLCPSKWTCKIIDLFSVFHKSNPCCKAKKTQNNAFKHKEKKMWSSERIQKKDSFWRDIQIKCDYDNPILKVVEFIQKEFTCVLLILYTIHSL